MKNYISLIYTGLGHLSKLLLGFILVKLIAYYQGPLGLGYIGHFMSAVTILVAVGGGGITNAIIKYSSEYKVDIKKSQNFLKTAFAHGVIFSTVIFFIALIFSKDISFLFFHSYEYFGVVIILALFIYIFAFNNLVAGYLNGIGRNSDFALIQIIGSIFIVPVAWYLIAYHENIGTIFAVLLVYSSVFIPAFFRIKKINFINDLKFGAVNWVDEKNLLRFMLITGVSATAYPVCEIFVRQTLINSVGYSEAGIWQGAMRISGAYIGFFSTFLAYYFIPKVSSNNNNLIKITLKTMMYVGFAFLLGAISFWIFRKLFIKTLLSNDFEKLNEIFWIQLFGDFFRVLAYVIGFLLIAKSAIFLCVLAEIVQNAFFILMVSTYSMNEITVKNVMILYCVNYFLYFTICLLGLYIYSKVNNR